jgi:hypothetical protein
VHLAHFRMGGCQGVLGAAQEIHTVFIGLPAGLFGLLVGMGQHLPGLLPGLGHHGGLAHHLVSLDLRPLADFLRLPLGGGRFGR